MIEAQPGVNCEPPRHLPIVLKEPLDIPQPVVSVCPRHSGLLVIQEISEQSVGVAVVGLEGIVGVSPKIELASARAKIGLKLGGALDVDTSLQRVRAPHSTDVVHEAENIV